MGNNWIFKSKNKRKIILLKSIYAARGTLTTGTICTFEADPETHRGYLISNKCYNDQCKRKSIPINSEKVTGLATVNNKNGRQYSVIVNGEHSGCYRELVRNEHRRIISLCRDIEYFNIKKEIICVPKYSIGVIIKGKPNTRVLVIFSDRHGGYNCFWLNPEEYDYVNPDFIRKHNIKAYINDLVCCWGSNQKVSKKQNLFKKIFEKMKRKMIRSIFGDIRI